MSLGGIPRALLAVCLLLSVVTSAGCRPQPEFEIGGLSLGTTVEEVARIAGQRISSIGDPSFLWQWFDGGLVVGFSRSTKSGALESRWILQTEGTYAGGGLSIGDSWLRAERLFGRAAEESTGQPRVHLDGGDGVSLDILERAGKVCAFILYLAPGQDPDVRMAGYEPGALPAFRLPEKAGIGILATPGSTCVYLEYDCEGGSTLVTSVVDNPLVYDGQILVPLRTLRENGPPMTFYFELVGDTVTLVADEDMQPVEYGSASPLRIYVGLEWSDRAGTYRVVGREDITVRAGRFPDAYVVEYTSVLSPGEVRSHYADGVGLVKEGDKLELIEFRPGGAGGG